MNARRLLLLFVCLFGSGYASAVDIMPGQAVVLWTGGSGAAIAATLAAIRGFMNDGGYGTVFTFAATLGFMVLMIKLAMRTEQFEKFPAYLIGLFLIIYVSQRITINVQVEDPVKGYASVVSDVPAIVGGPAVLASELGHWLTSAIEHYYRVPASLPSGVAIPDNYGTLTETNRFNLMGTMMKDLSEIRINDPGMRGSFRAYVADCAAPQLYTGQINFQELVGSSNPWGVLTATPNSYTFTTYYGPANNIAGNSVDPLGSVVNCREAAEQLTLDLDDFVYPSAVEGIARKQSFLGNFEVFSWTEGALNSAMAWTSNGAINTASTAVRQTAVINTFIDTSSSIMNSVAGGEGIAYNMALAEARSAQESNWAIAADIFSTFMGYFYVVLHVFVIALSPVIILLLLIPGMAGKIGGSYMKILIWLALWQPALSVVNFIANQFLLDGLGEPYIIPGGGFTLGSVTTVSAATEKAVMAANFMGSMVPMFMWGVINATGYAFTQFVGAGTGASQAAGAAGKVASDSINHGTHSMDVTRANKFDMAYDTSIGDNGVKSTNAVGQLGVDLMNGTTRTGMSGGGALGNVSTEKREAVSSESSRQSSATTTDKSADSNVVANTHSNGVSGAGTRAAQEQVQASLQQSSSGTRVRQGSELDQSIQTWSANYGSKFQMEASQTNRNTATFGVGADVGKALRALTGTLDKAGATPQQKEESLTAAATHALDNPNFSGMTKAEKGQAIEAAVNNAMAADALEAASEIAPLNTPEGQAAADKYLAKNGVDSVVDGNGQKHSVKGKGALAKIAGNIPQKKLLDAVLGGLTLRWDKGQQAISSFDAGSSVERGAGRTDGNSNSFTFGDQSAYTTGGTRNSSATGTAAEGDTVTQTEGRNVSSADSNTAETANTSAQSAQTRKSVTQSQERLRPDIAGGVRGRQSWDNEVDAQAADIAAQMAALKSKTTKGMEETKAESAAVVSETNTKIADREKQVPGEGAVSSTTQGKNVDSGAAVTQGSKLSTDPITAAQAEVERAQGRLAIAQSNGANAAQNQILDAEAQTSYGAELAKIGSALSADAKRDNADIAEQSENAGGLRSAAQWTQRLLNQGQDALGYITEIAVPEANGGVISDIYGELQQSGAVANSLAIQGGGEANLRDFAVVGEGSDARLRGVYQVPFEYTNDAGANVQGMAAGVYVQDGQFFPLGGASMEESRSFTTEQLSQMGGQFVSGATMDGNTLRIGGREFDGSTTNSGAYIPVGQGQSFDRGMINEGGDGQVNGGPNPLSSTTGGAVQDAGTVNIQQPAGPVADPVQAGASLDGYHASRGDHNSGVDAAIAGERTTFPQQGDAQLADDITNMPAYGTPEYRKMMDSDFGSSVQIPLRRDEE